jgi:hypothetical protein
MTGMQLTTDEFMVLLSTIVALPVVAVLTIAYLRGGFRNSEAARYAALQSDDIDFWAPVEDAPIELPMTAGGGPR